MRAASDRTVRLRAHARAGRPHLYGGSYGEDSLRWWADRVGEWEAAGREVFVYFNNDGDGNAVRNAGRLREILGR